MYIFINTLFSHLSSLPIKAHILVVWKVSCNRGVRTSPIFLFFLAIRDWCLVIILAVLVLVIWPVNGTLLKRRPHEDPLFLHPVLVQGVNCILRGFKDHILFSGKSPLFILSHLVLPNLLLQVFVWYLLAETYLNGLYIFEISFLQAARLLLRLNDFWLNWVSCWLREIQLYALSLFFSYKVKFLFEGLLLVMEQESIVESRFKILESFHSWFKLKDQF
jgi:hypothetical protein